MLSPPTSLAVWDQKQICPFLRLKRTFSPWVFWWTPPYPFLSVFSCLALNRARLERVSLSNLTCANCDQLIPFQFSAKNTFHAFTTFKIGRFPLPTSLPQSQQNPLTKLYIKVASQEEFCCAKQRLFGFCHGSQTSRIIPTTLPPLQLTVKSRRFTTITATIYLYKHRHFHSHTHKQKTHNSMI